MIQDLFADDVGIELIDTDGRLTYWHSLLPPAQADSLFQELYDHCPWRQESIHIYGQSQQQPRLTCWFGRYSASASSGYEQLTSARPFTPNLLALKHTIEQHTGYGYNSVLINLYRDGQDSVGYHADDEDILGDKPAIASYSLGATRRFLLKHNQGKVESIGIDLQHNSLLLMAGDIQQHWQHAISKTKRAIKPRINLTFRWLSA